jgi:hypothetical protein
MKLTKYQIVATILTGLLCIPSANAFKLGGDDPDVIWRSGAVQVIKYNAQDDSRFGKNNHPVDLDVNDITNALKALYIPDDSFMSKDTDHMPVFTFEQMKLLGENLSKGLKNAKPDQDIIFILGKSHRKLLLLTSKEYMAGRAFYKDGKLNIIIGNYALPRNDAFESVYDPSGQGNVPYAFNFGSRTNDSGEIKNYIVRADGIENKVIANKLRKDWFVIDVKTAALTAINRNNKDKAGNIDTEAIRQETEQLAKERRQLRLEMAKMRKEMQEGTNKEQLSTEDRLARLRELLDKKMITEAEYEQKRKEILDDI